VTPVRSAALREWREGWTLVLAATFGVSLGGLQIYSTGLFLQPLEREYGWSRSEISGAMAVPAIMGVLFSPFFGMLIDRWGARALALPGAMLCCASFAALSLAGPSILSWWLLWIAIGVASLCLKPTVWSTAVSARFVVSRGLALAVMLCGTGLASAIIPPLTNMLIDAFGWRGAYIGLGLVFGVTVVPVLWLFFHDARRNPSGPSAASSRPVSGLTAREGFRTRQFWQLGAAALLITAVIVGSVVHLVPILSDNGLPRGEAAFAAGLTGIFSVIGRLGVGYLFDRLPGPPVGAASVILPVVAAGLLLAFPGSLPAALIAIGFLGLAVGGEYDSIIYLATRYFGMRSFGTLFGCIGSALLAGVGLGPIVAAAFYDRTGSYAPFLWGAIPLCLVTALLLGTLGRYPEHKADQETRP